MIELIAVLGFGSILVACAYFAFSSDGETTHRHDCPGCHTGFVCSCHKTHRTRLCPSCGGAKTLVRWES